MVAFTEPKQSSLLISLLLNFIINIIFLEMFKQNSLATFYKQIQNLKS